MKLKIIGIIFMLLLLLPVILFSNCAHAEEPGLEEIFIKVAIPVSRRGKEDGVITSVFVDIIHDVLNNYSWVVDDREYKFVTKNVTPKERDSYDKLEDYDLIVIDGVSEELHIFGLEDVSKIPKIRDGIKEWKKAFEKFVIEGGGYIGRCGGALLPLTYHGSPDTPHELHEIERSAFLEDAPVSAEIKQGLPILSELYKAHNFPFKERIAPRVIPDPSACGNGAYGYYNGMIFPLALNNQSKMAGACVNLTDLDKSHPILDDFHGDRLFMRQMAGPAFHIEDNEAPCLARFPDQCFETSTSQQVSIWNFRPKPRHIIPILLLLQFVKNRVMGTTQTISIDDLPLEWQGLFEEGREYTVFPELYDIVTRSWPWEKTEYNAVTRFPGNPAIVAFQYGDGRMVLSGPHIFSNVWTGGKIVDSDDPVINTRRKGLYHWEKSNGEWITYESDYTFKGREVEDKSVNLEWYFRREAAWASAVQVPGNHLPPVYGRSQVLDIDPYHQDNKFTIQCCVGRDGDEPDWTTENLSLFYRYNDSGSWTNWTLYDSTYGYPYQFTFNASNANGSGEYQFCSLYNTSYVGVWDPKEENEEFPPDYDAQCYCSNITIVADFSYSPINPYAMDNITFTDESLALSGTHITNYSWSFGDGDTSYEQNVTHQYADDGMYVVWHNVTNNVSDNDSKSITIKVNNIPPHADFTPKYKVAMVGESVNFTGNSSDTDGSIVGWYWDFGDGNISENQNTSHSYSASGYYSISLNVTDDDGDSRKATGGVLVVDSFVNSTGQGDNIYGSIQDAVDNASTLDFVYVNNGFYNENLTINKSITLIGENRSNVVINGSVVMVNHHDYEFPENGSVDLSVVVNMTGNELLLHFNNDSNVGEDYSLSDCVYDYSGEGNNETCFGATLDTGTLKGQGCFAFDGVDDSVNLSALSALAGENVTVSAWVHWTGGSGVDPIVSQRNATHGYCLYVNSTKPAFCLDGEEALSDVAITNGWHYLAGTHNQTELRIYVDGVLRGSTSKQGSGVDTVGYIGFDNNTHYFDGNIDEVAVWNRTLADWEIDLIYDSNYGISMEGFTIQNSDVGITVCNHSDVSDCILLNHTVGVLLNNSGDSYLHGCNISGVTTGVKVIDSNPEWFYSNSIVDCMIDNATSAIVVNASSNLSLVRDVVNGYNSNLTFFDCDFDSIAVMDCFSPGNVAPDKPSLSGPTLGDPNTSYTYYSNTNDSNDDQILYWFDWDDGNTSGWIWFYSSNETVNISHIWTKQGGYRVRVKAKDVFDNESDWSETVLFRTETLPPLVNSVNHTPDPVGFGGNITIVANVTDDKSGNWSGIRYVNVSITYPDNSTGNFTMDDIGNNTYEYVFGDTWLVGQYNYTIWAVDNAYNTNSSAGHDFSVEHLFGYTTTGSMNQSVDDRITGSVFTAYANGKADNITAYIQANLGTLKAKCMIYRKNDSALIGTTEELTPNGNPSWVTFNFSDPKPTLVENTEYVLTCWSNDTCYLYYDNISSGSPGRYKNMSYDSPPDSINWTGNETRLYSIYCSYTTIPVITDVSNSPGVVGFGFNVTIGADVSDRGCSIDTVKVNVSYPNNSTGNFTMDDTGNNTYEYVFGDTWLVGQYNYTIWAVNEFGGSNSDSGHSFNVSANATISVCTIKDSYGDNETVNLTDPPGDPPSIGYELLDDGDVLHIWNEYNSYYFNTSSGIQLTNHYGEYWSHNVLMLGYYNNDEWNLIYRTDELSGFDKNIDGDNETFVNATLWKDLTYGGYDFRLAVRYYLGTDDSDLTVIPYIKNLGQAIPYTLGFGWEIKDIKISDTYENDSIRLYNGTDWNSYRLNQTLDNKYTDMDYNTTFYLEGRNEGTYFRRTLYLKWNHTLDYLLKVKSRTGEYNAPVTLFIKIGTLDVDQEKYTELNWLDSDSWLGVDGQNYHSCCGYEGPYGPAAAFDGIDVWTHLSTENHWVVVDLKDNYNVKKVRGRSDIGNDPTSVDIYISDDASSWAPAVVTGITTWQDTSNWVEVDITDTVGRYINISITSTEGGAGVDYLEFGKIPTPMTIFDVYGEKVYAASYYFNSYNNNVDWATNPGYMVDGSTSNYASTILNGDVEQCTGNTCSGTNLGTITKVELRAYGYYATTQRDITLIPVFGGSIPGNEYIYQTTSTAGWSSWFNITDDNSAPNSWSWTDVADLDCEVHAKPGAGPFTLYCSKVEVRVVYDPVPVISNPVPADGSTGVSLTPTLNITVSDSQGDNMTITWLSNSSGSWQSFGTNVTGEEGNGTYHQIFSNATVNGQWWYWRVNVSDGTGYNISSVYKFYTGYQSKIENIGSTYFKGYLLIQVQYYNTSSSTWVVADDTVNESSPRTITLLDQQGGNVLALDTIFNGLVNTSNLSEFGNGTYRIYAALRDPDGNILKCDDDTELVATYEFTITFD